MVCIDTNIFTIDEIRILETMKNNYNKKHKLLEVIYMDQKYTVKEYDICDFMEESNIDKICEILNYLDDGEYYNGGEDGNKILFSPSPMTIMELNILCINLHIII